MWFRLMFLVIIIYIVSRNIFVIVNCVSYVSVGLIVLFSRLKCISVILMVFI